MIIHWTGAAWHKVRAPAGASAFMGVTRWSAARSPVRTDMLIGVTSASASSAWAVGASRPFSKHTKLAILRWNGVTWSLARGPRLAADSLLAGVTARSARSAWAVGASFRPNIATPLILHWNGTRWKVAPS